MEENKTTWAIFFSVLMVLWKGFANMMVGLWKAFVEILSFPARAGVLVIVLLTGFFVGKHFPIQDSKKEIVPVTSEVAQPVKVKQATPKVMVANNNAEAEKAKAKADADLKAKAEEARRKSDEAKGRAEAEAKAKTIVKAKAMAEVSKVTPVRDTIVVDEDTVYFLDKDPEREFYLEEYVDGGKGKDPILKKTSKEKPCKPFDRIHAKNGGKYMMLKLVSNGYESPMMTFTKENTPAAVIFENGEATIYKDLSVLPVELIYPN